MTGGYYNHTTACSRTVAPHHALVSDCCPVSMSLSLLTGLGCSLCQHWVCSRAFWKSSCCVKPFCFWACLGWACSMDSLSSETRGLSERAWELGCGLWDSETHPGSVTAWSFSSPPLSSRISASSPFVEKRKLIWDCFLQLEGDILVDTGDHGCSTL